MPELAPPPMPPFRRARLLKRWRYVGAFSPQVMVSVADVHVGPLPVRFFAVAEPDGAIATGAPLRRDAIRLSASRARVRTRRVTIDLELEEERGVATWHDERRIWTRKQAGIPARLEVTLDGRSHTLDCRGVVDDTAGYHPRRTCWWWCAGVGLSASGVPVAWNLVSGVNDEPHGSERAIWIDGVAREPEPVTFAGDLSRVDFSDGTALRFSAWAERRASTNLLVVRSRYRQPFGTFSGELPGAGTLAEGYGVMEWHEAYW